MGVVKHTLNSWVQFAPITLACTLCFLIPVNPNTVSGWQNQLISSCNLLAVPVSCYIVIDKLIF